MKLTQALYETDTRAYAVVIVSADDEQSRPPMFTILPHYVALVLWLDWLVCLQCLGHPLQRPSSTCLRKRSRVGWDQDPSKPAPGGFVQPHMGCNQKLDAAWQSLNPLRPPFWFLDLGLVFRRVPYVSLGGLKHHPGGPLGSELWLLAG